MNMKRLCLLCAVLLLSQLLLVACEKQHDGKKEGEKEKDKARKEKPADGGNQRAAKKEERKPAASGQNEKGQKQKGGKSAPKGKFSTKEKAECTWAVTEADSVSLRVECTQQGVNNFSCVFAGNPSACPQYAANPKAYWKQITRALKKQTNICQDPKAVLKAKDCKRGPHFSFLSSTLLEAAPTMGVKKHHRNKKGPKTPAPTSAIPGPSASSTECAEDADSVDQKKVAEEYCGDTWSSFCTFFIAMLQNKKC